MRLLHFSPTKTLLSLLSMTLRNAGHEVAEAENGEEGLARFDQFKPDLVITDLNMPVMDGIEFTRACRSRPAGQNTPIIVLTTENGAEIQAEGRRAGARAARAQACPNIRPGPQLTTIGCRAEVNSIASVEAWACAAAGPAGGAAASSTTVARARDSRAKPIA